MCHDTTEAMMDQTLTEFSEEAAAHPRGRMPSGVPLSALPLFFFLHIPKTAGTTARATLTQMFGKAFTLFQNGNEIMEIHKDPADWRTETEFFAHHLLIGGHFPVIHPMIRLSRARPVRYFLSLWRDPVRRAQSFYDYARRRPTHFLYPEISSLDFVDAVRRSETFIRVSMNQQLFMTFGARDCARAEAVLQSRNYIIADNRKLDAFFDTVAAISGMRPPGSIPRYNSAEEEGAPLLTQAADQPGFAEACDLLRAGNAEEYRFMQTHLSEVLVSFGGHRPAG